MSNSMVLTAAKRACRDIVRLRTTCCAIRHSPRSAADRGELLFDSGEEVMPLLLRSAVELVEGQPERPAAWRAEDPQAPQDDPATRLLHEDRPPPPWRAEG